MLDWEICTIGNPAADLAYLNNYSYGATGAENAARAAGMPSRASLLLPGARFRTLLK